MRVASRLSVRALDLWPYLVIAVCSAILFRDGLFGESVFYERDTYLFYEPLGRWFAERLREGQIPLWMPLIFGGYPLFADGEIGMLYPLNLLLLPFFDGAAQLTVPRAVHFFLAGAFMVAFLRELGLRVWGRLVGGLVFAFSSFFITQVHHENLIRSAVWLPLILLFVERGFQRRGWARQRSLVAAGLALAIAGQGLHVQGVAMSLVAIAIFTTYRAIAGPFEGPLWERALLLAWAPLVVIALGLAGSAIQWLPLYELGRMSYRGPGLTYELATTWPLRWQNLATVVFPYLFRMEDGRYVTLWQQWESFLYVGMATLVLGALGLLVARRRIAIFFVIVAVCGVAVGLADQSPFNVHRLLWEVPAFSSLRAPGRFAYLVVFGMAGLSAIGADWLLTLQRRSWIAAGVGLTAVVSSVGLAWVAVSLHARMIADPIRWLGLIDQHYIAAGREHAWLTGRMVYDQLIAGLDLGQPKTTASVVLLSASGMVVVVAALWPRRSAACGAAIVLLLMADLLMFGHDFHPIAALDDLVRPGPITEYLAENGGDGRAFAESEVRGLEPNRLMHRDVASVLGYSSLQSQRHFEYSTNVDRQPDALLDIWGPRYLAMIDPPTDVLVIEGTAYRPYAPLFNGAAFNRVGFSEFRVEPSPTVEIRILSTLLDAVDVEQGSPVAEVSVFGANGGRRSHLLRAGIDTAENAYERSDVRPRVRHALATVGGNVPDISPTGQPNRTNLYFSRLPIDPLDVVRVELRQLHPTSQTRIFGLGLASATGAVRSLFNADRAKLARVAQLGGAAIFTNSQAYPRAYVVSEGIPRRSRAEESALSRLAKRPFDSARQVLLEDGPFEGIPLSEPEAPQQPDPAATPTALEVVDESPERVRVAIRDGPGGFLVLNDSYHRGWKARVDGEPAHVYVANFLARAVQIPARSHNVEFVFDPLSLRLGRAVTISALVFAAIVVLAPFNWLTRRLRRKRGICPPATSADTVVS